MNHELLLNYKKRSVSLHNDCIEPLMYWNIFWCWDLTCLCVRITSHRPTHYISPSCICWECWEIQTSVTIISTLMGVSVGSQTPPPIETDRDSNDNCSCCTHSHSAAFRIIRTPGYLDGAEMVWSCVMVWSCLSDNKFVLRHCSRQVSSSSSPVTITTSPFTFNGAAARLLTRVFIENKIGQWRNLHPTPKVVNVISTIWDIIV